MDACDSWAVREMYTARWATNCTNAGLPHGSDCCLLKRKGWRMEPARADCTSGGKSPAPPAPGPRPRPSPPPPPPPPPSPPLPKGGGACATEWDCSLGGECTAGECVCDAQYTGPLCGVVALRRAKPDNGMQVNGTHTWGGHALKDPASGSWVGYFSYMAAGCDLATWQSNSASVYAATVGCAPCRTPLPAPASFLPCLFRRPESEAGWLSVQMIIKAVADAPDGQVKVITNAALAQPQPQPMPRCLLARPHVLRPRMRCR